MLDSLLDAGYVPVVSPLAADDDGRVLNVNADTVAATIACALDAEKLIFLTETPGILEDRADKASMISCADLKVLAMMEARGALAGGMLPKVNAARAALAGGVRRVHIVGYQPQARPAHGGVHQRGGGDAHRARPRRAARGRAGRRAAGRRGRGRAVTDAELLALHREMVAIPSLSGRGGAARRRSSSGSSPRAARASSGSATACSRSPDSGPVVCLNSHLDTVPASPAWTRPPHRPQVEDGRVYGLGSNDAKGAVAAMTAAFLRLAARGDDLGVRVVLALAAEEEVGSKGTERLVPELARRGLRPDAVVVGEPTDLDVATSQKGLLVLELVTAGRACHAAHGRALGAPNALRALGARPRRPRRGGPRPRPPQARAGHARADDGPRRHGAQHDPGRGVVRPRRARQPGASRRRRSRPGCRRPYRASCAWRAPACARTRSPRTTRSCGRRSRRGRRRGRSASRGLSDLVFFTGIPGIKVGPGSSERSHTPDEFVLEGEVLEGARFYERLVLGSRTFLGEGRAA